MRGDSVVFEVTEEEIRALWFTVPSWRRRRRNRSHICNSVKFERIPLTTGLIEQGSVRNEQGLAALLKNYGLQHNWQPVKAYLAIPLQQGFARVYSLPWLAKRDRNSAIALLMSEEAPLNSADLLYDFQVIAEEKAEKVKILLAAARRSILERYVHIFKEAGFIVREINFAFCILGQALSFKPEEDVLYLQAEGGSLQAVLFRGAVPDNVHTLVSFSSAEGTQGGLPEDLKSLENEIRHFLMYYSTQHKDFKLNRLVWKGDPIAGQLAQRIQASNNSLKTEPALFGDRSDFWRKVLEENKGLSEISTGYALNICAHRSSLNLWQQPNREQRLRKIFGGLAVLSGALIISGTMAGFWLQQKAESLLQEAELLSRQNAEVLKQSQERESLERRWEKETNQQEKLAAGLREVCALRGSELDFEEVTYRQGSLSLIGKTPTSQGVETLLQELRVLGWSRPALTSYQLIPAGNVRFSVSARYGGDSEKVLKRSLSEESKL